MFKRIMKKNSVVTNKRKGFSFMEVLLALVLIVAMSTGAFFVLNTAQQTRKMAQMNNDMDAIVNSVLTYEALSIDGNLPADLASCVAGLTADEAIDGVAHPNILKWTKSTTDASGTPDSASFVNPWGTVYTYSKADRTLTTKPQDGSGAELSIVTRYF